VVGKPRLSLSLEILISIVGTFQSRFYSVKIQRILLRIGLPVPQQAASNSGLLRRAAGTFSSSSFRQKGSEGIRLIVEESPLLRL
jgi:hypothetical protein